MNKEMPSTPQRKVRTITRPEVAGWFVLLECGHGLQTFNPSSLAAICASWSSGCRTCFKELRDAAAVETTPVEGVI